MKGEIKQMPINKLDEWEVKNSLDTLVQAEKIKKDPKLMKAVKREANKQKQALIKVTNKKNKI